MSNADQQPIRVLLVDDEEEFVNVLARRMARRNISVTTALNGTEALQKLRYNDYDVAVIDLKMEGLDGIETLKIFQIMAPDVAVIMLTGHGCQISAREGLSHGAFDYLSKPYDFKQLLQKIREAHQSRINKP